MQIQANTLSLARLQETTDILRRVIRILQLSKKLAANMTGQSEPDLAKVSAYHRVAQERNDSTLKLIMEERYRLTRWVRFGAGCGRVG